MPEMFRRIEDFILFLRLKGVLYQVRAIQGEMRAGLGSYLFKCQGKDGEEKQFNLHATGLLTVFDEVVEKGQRTGSKMFVLMNADRHTFNVVNLNQVKEKFPGIAELLKRMEEKKYIT
jgi:hypothetical protein